MSYSWFRAGTATVTNGSNLVRFQDAKITTSPVKPVIGDAFMLNGLPDIYELIDIGSDSTGEFARLHKAYSGATAQNQQYACMRLASGTQNNKLVAMAAAAINQKQISLDDMYEWYTSEDDTVDFLGPDDTIVTLKTYHKLTQEISDVGGNAGAITIVATNIDKVIDVSNNMSAVIAATASATQAASSASAALASKNAAESSATAAASSASSALTSKNAAATSEANALTSKNAAASSATAAATSATNAANSATAALASKNAAATSETNAASSAASALASKNAAAISETNAAASAFQSFAMSQAQFDAIRAQNNEEFAASGFVRFGKHGEPPFAPVNNGLYTYAATPLSNKMALGRIGSGALGDSKTKHPIVNIAGVIFNIDGAGDSNTACYIKFPQAPDGRTTYNKSTGTVTTYDHAYQAFAAAEADPTNIEVVTDRVDMWGFEAWLEEVSTANPFVYPNGLIQSQASTMDGITTSASNRPVTYYAVFDGDTSSKGRGVNFFALTDTQKKKVLANPKNNLFFGETGKLYQWRLRQRTIAGAGNGGWDSIDSEVGARFLGFGKVLPLPQGYRDVVGAGGTYTTGAALFVGAKLSLQKQHSYVGAFSVRSLSWEGISYPNAVGINGECYFLVCGTVSRLNQGAYHPSFNPMGTAKNRNSTGSWRFWYESSDQANTSKADCFRPFPYNANLDNGGFIGTQSGRPDGRFYDAIYADGQGGVCRDMRYSAYGVDSVDFAEADQRVKNGTYRGFEKRVFSRVGVSDSATYTGAWNTFNHMGIPADVGDSVIVEVSPNNFERKTVQSYTPTQIAFQPVAGGTRPANLKFAVESPMPQSVGGSFLQTDVIGDPANILQVDALKNGWEGSWIPVIPDGTVKDFPYTRKKIAETVLKGYAIFTTDLGESWRVDAYTGTGDDVNNTFATLAGITGESILVIPYQAFAKQTEPANNEVVYGGVRGVGKVLVSMWYQPAYGSLLCESVLGIILKENVAYGLVNRTANLIYFAIEPGGTFHYYRPEQTPLYENVNMASPRNSSQAFKALDYNVSINQQGFKQYAATELIHDGTDWGDDGRVTIVDGESTKTDLNGNTVKVVTHKLKEPIGWIRNEV